MNKKRIRGNPFPLIVEPHPSNYTGYPFITLIQYDNNDLLTVVDNATEKSIQAFVLDMCGPEKVDEEKLIIVATKWYNEHREQYPLSFEFSRLGLSQEMSRVYRTFNVEFVSRIIGPLPKFEMSQPHKVKRRKRKPITTFPAK